MGWNLRPINSSLPEYSLTVTTLPPWGDCECKQLPKQLKWGCMAIHRSGLHTVTHHPFKHTDDAVLLAWLVQHHRSSLVEAIYIGRQMQSCFPPCSLPCPDPVFPSTAASAGGKIRGSFLSGVMLLHHPYQAQISASHKGLALLLLWWKCDLCFSSSSICFIQGNHCAKPWSHRSRWHSSS